MTASARLSALTRDVSPALARCELSFVDREPIDVALAQHQHEAYVHALREAGVDVHRLPAEQDLPDSVFVEDTAVVIGDAVLITRPGASSRRPETTTIAAYFDGARTVLPWEGEGSLDGGDVLRIGSRYFVGRSARSSAAGIAHLTRQAEARGFTVTSVLMRDCLHLKSAVTALDDHTVLLNPSWVERSSFDGFRQIEVDPSEPHAANVLRLPDRLIYPDNFPRTAARLESAGFRVVRVALSELQKAEGAVTCCSVLY